MTGQALPSLQDKPPVSEDRSGGSDSPSVKQECADTFVGNGVAGGSTMLATATTTTATGKKRANPSSRGVANLTAEQLAKKRANDREAQRAIRKRTRTQIEVLEQRVRELTSLQPYQDLQEAQRQKRTLQIENDEMRRRLASVVAIIQPLLEGHPASLTPASIPPSPRSDIPPHSNGLGPSHTTIPPSPLSQSEHNPQQGSHNFSFERQHQPPTKAGSGYGSGVSSYPNSATASMSPSPSLHGQWQGHLQSWQQSLPSSNLRSPDHGWPSHNQLFDYQKKNLTHNLEFSGNGEKLGFNFLLDSTQDVPRLNDFHLNASSSSSVNISLTYNSRLSNPPYTDDNIYPYSAPIRNVEATCPLDGILLEFLRSRQREAAEGVPSRQLVGPPYPSVSSLLNPAKSIYSHPLSKVFTDILSKFPNISNLPEQVAVLYVMFLLMRWQIYPTRENYERLPEWITPRKPQLVTPHAAWLDYLPWPRMRDRMVASYADYDFSNWFIPYTTGLSLNWPYEPTDVLLATNDSEELIINPVFERHLRDLNNWSLGTLFATTYPHLVDTTRIVPEKNPQHGGRSNSA